MSPKRRRAYEVMELREDCYPRTSQTENPSWHYQLIFLICYNTGKWETCILDIGTNKGKMVALKWPRFSDSHWWADEHVWGEKLCSAEASHGACVAGACRDWGGQVLCLDLCFSEPEPPSCCRPV